MDTALRTTAEYLKTRKQFGVTLNKFQALTFRAADMYVSLELARSIALWASMVQDAGGDVVTRRRPRPAADQPRRPAHRQGGHPAARRHRRDRGVLASATTPAGSPRSTTCSATATGPWPGSPARSTSTRPSTRWAPRTPALRPGAGAGRARTAAGALEPGQRARRPTTSRFAQPGEIADAAASTVRLPADGPVRPAQRDARSCTTRQAAAATSSAVSRTPSRPTLAAAWRVGA